MIRSVIRLPFRRQDTALAALLLAAFLPVRADMFTGVAAFDRGDFETALRELTPLAESGETEAQYYVARMYHQGHVVQDLEKAAEWYRSAATAGHAGAQNNLGVLYEQGLGVPASDSEAARWYRLAADQSLVVAEVNLATLYEEGRGVDRDPEEALRWYRRAADTGHVNAQYHLARIFDEGITGPADPERAARWYQAAAEQGHAPSQLALARLYEQGRGVEPSEAKANKWRRKARAQGLAEPGALTSEGSPAAPSPVAAELPPERPEPPLEPAPEPAPEPPSSEKTLPSDVEPLPPDLQELRRSALEGNGAASYELARRYSTGNGVPESRIEAGRWYLAAAEAGHATSAYQLGLQYFHGHGVADGRDLVRSHLWFSVAAQAGIGDAAEWRDRVAQKLTRKELEEATALFQERSIAP